jgi:hypothetical protein
MDEMFWRIGGPNGEACRKILEDNLELFQAVQGSTDNHQAWPGGYYDHVLEAMNTAFILYNSLSHARPLPFTRPDALFIVFLHDIEKPWQYELRDDGQLHHVLSMETREMAHAFRKRKLAEYGIELTPKLENALNYDEGKSTDRSPSLRLGAFCHLAAVASAHIWHDHPMKRDDPWKGARRVRG